MKILIISAEVAPFAKVGGLADVAGALPKALRDLGHDVRVAMPCYKMIESNAAFAVTDLLQPFPVHIDSHRVEQAFVRQTTIHASSGDVPVLLVGNVGRNGRPGYFEEATESRKVYSLSPDPYVFFCRAVLEMINRLDDGWFPDVLHCNDWQSGLVPVLARTDRSRTTAVAKTACVFTIHNLAYQGNFNWEDWAATGLPLDLYNVDGMEFYGGWSFMKGGLTFSDRINTVSETYAREIKTAGYACGLEGLMQTLGSTGRLSGILNGIDFEEYDPKTDPRLPAHFSVDDLSGKQRCKSALQAELGLATDARMPVVGLVSRLADQKGLDLIHAISEQMVGLPVQFALLGAGDSYYERYFKELEERHPGRVQARIDFDVELAQRIYAGSDMFLMPSRFEPCGLGQMMALRYGTIPIVRKTGGLADSIQPYTGGRSADGNGFVFEDYTPEALLETIRAAVALYRQPSKWKQLVLRALQCDFSWERSAVRYEALYCEALSARSAGVEPLALDSRERA